MTNLQELRALIERAAEKVKDCYAARDRMDRGHVGIRNDPVGEKMIEAAESHLSRLEDELVWKTYVNP